MPDQFEIARIVAKHQGHHPVNVSAIAADLGIEIYADNLGPKVSGILRKDFRYGGKSGYVILVNRDHHLNRQRFTVAHELGHFILHRSYASHGAGITDDEFYRALSGPLETEANSFAADLLMPWKLINAITDSGVKELDKLAKELGVSKQALAIRLGLPYDQSWD